MKSPSFCAADLNNGWHPVPCWVHTASYWSSASSWTWTTAYSKMKSRMWLQPNSCRAGLHMSPVVICMLKKLLITLLQHEQVSAAWESPSTCDELIVPEIQEQPRLTPPWRDNNLPSPKQSPALNLPTWGRCVFHFRFQQEDFAKMSLLKSWSGLLVLKSFF